MRTYPVVERNESIYIWHDTQGRDPYFGVPDVFAGFEDGSSLADYWPRASLYEQRLELHPQYVLENGVDVEHFKFVHKTPIVPVFTRHDFDNPVSYVDFTITFEGDENQSIDDVKSGVEAINGGLGIAVTKSCLLYTSVGQLAGGKEPGIDGPFRDVLDFELGPEA